MLGSNEVADVKPFRALRYDVAKAGPLVDLIAPPYDVVDEAPTAWVVAQDYVGPDAVSRTRVGLVAALRLEPYDRGVVLPHERTHRGPKEGRLRLLRATRTQLEPI